MRLYRKISRLRNLGFRNFSFTSVARVFVLPLNVILIEQEQRNYRFATTGYHCRDKTVLSRRATPLEIIGRFFFRRWRFSVSPRGRRTENVNELPRNPESGVLGGIITKQRSDRHNTVAHRHRKPVSFYATIKLPLDLIRSSDARDFRLFRRERAFPWICDCYSL